MSLHEQRPVSDPDLEAPDLGFKAGFGFYLGIIAAGITAVAGILADASTAAVLATAPGTVTAVMLIVFIVGDQLRGFPERLGRRRRRRLVCYLPTAAFAAVMVVPAYAPLEYTARFTVTTLAFVLITGATALGVSQMAKNRYVAAMTDNEPVAAWTYQPSGYDVGEYAFTVGMAVMIVGGLAMAVAGGWFYGLFVAGYGALLLLSNHLDLEGKWGTEFEPDERWNPPRLEAHGAGLVREHSHTKKFVPWDAIDGVELTDDELVLERRWRTIRCDRSAIDDPEAVLRGIEGARVYHNRQRP